MSIKHDAVWAPAPATNRGQPTQLSTDPKGQRIAYASNKSVFLRSIDEPSLSTQYTAHTAATSVARFSPSGYYVASGDVSGTVRVWDCVSEGATKGEYHIISGRINDIAWDGDSQRIIAVGDGKDRFGHCITADSGNSVGEISGQSSQINSVSIRQQRPLRAATGSDDTSLAFYHGAPFKFNTSLRDQHSKFVYGVAFSPDGSNLVSVGGDRKVCLYDGKTGEAKGSIGDGEHKGSVFSVAWSPDSTRFATASADQTVKVWDVAAGKVVQDWRFGEDGQTSISHHQVGVAWPMGWTDGLVISLSLAGDLNYLEQGNSKPRRVVQGHQKNITTISAGEPSGSNDRTLWTGSYEGRVCGWDLATGTGKIVDGESHSNQVAGFAATPKGTGTIYSVGWDDTIRTIDASQHAFTETAKKVDGQPRGIANLDEERVAVITPSGIEVYQDATKRVGVEATAYTPTAIAATHDSSGRATVAVGGEDHVVRVYELPAGSTKLELRSELKGSTAAITSLAYSPTQRYLAAGNSSGKIFVYGTADDLLVTDRWSAHSGRVTSIAWNDESTHAVSGGLDTHVYVWSIAKPGRRIQAANAHKDGVNGVVWVKGQNQVVSVGGDAAVKVWKVEGL